MILALGRRRTTMEFFDTVRKRGSYRSSFEQVDIPEKDINLILEAGAVAPSGGNLQTPVFYAVINEILRKKLAEVFPTEAVQTAPVILVVTSKSIIYEDGLAFGVEDYAAATENIILAITALGYAGVWMDGMMKLNENDKKVRQILKIPEEETIRTIIPFGIPAEPVTQKEKKPLSERVHIL